MAEERVVRYVITGNPTGAVSAFAKTGASADAAANSIEKTGKRVKSFGSSMVSAGHTLSRLSIPLIAVGGYAIKSAMDFQSSMTMLQTQAGASAREVTSLSSAVLKLGPKVAESPEELAKALYPIRSVGLSGASAISALTAAAKGAQVSGAGLTEVAEAVSGAMRVQMKEVRSASGAMGIMNGIVGLGKMHLADLTGAMSTGILPAAKNVGLGFRSVGAALSVMTRQGIPAESEATRLRTNLTKMVAPTGAALRALRRIGLGQFSLAEDMRKPNGLVTALRDLHEHLSRVSKNEQELVIAQAFGGAKGSANVVGLLNALPEMEHIRGELNRYGEKQLNQAFGTRSQESAFKMQQALDAVRSSLVSLGQTIMPVVVPAIQKIAQSAQHFFEWFSKLPKPVRDATVYLGMLLAVGGPLLIFFGSTIKAAGSMILLFGKLGSAGSGFLSAVSKLTSILPGFGAAAGEASTAASTGIAGLLADIAPLLAAAAALLAAYEAIKAIKEYFGHGGGGAAHSTGAKALKRLHQPSNFQAATGGAIAMLRGRQPTISEIMGMAPGSAGEARYLKEHLAYGPGRTELQGHAAAETAEGRAFRQAIKERNEQIVIHNHVHLDGSVVAESVTKHVRNNPQYAKPIAEGVTKYGQNKVARGG